MGKYKDSKGVSVSICIIPEIKKVITRSNYTENGKKKKLIKIFGVEYESLHSEIRVLLTIIKNPLFLKKIQKYKELKITNLRYSKTGNLAKCSKPCEKCQIVLKQFKEKYQLKRIIVEYVENGKIKELEI
jgi:intein/homing endonuclease